MEAKGEAPEVICSDCEEPITGEVFDTGEGPWSGYENKPLCYGCHEYLMTCLEE